MTLLQHIAAPVRNELKFKSFLTQPDFWGSTNVSWPAHAPIFRRKSARFEGKRSDFFGWWNHRVASVGIRAGGCRASAAARDLLLGDNEPTSRYFVQRTRGWDLNEITQMMIVAFRWHSSSPLAHHHPIIITLSHFWCQNCLDVCMLERSSTCGTTLETTCIERKESVSIR